MSEITSKKNSLPQPTIKSMIKTTEKMPATEVVPNLNISLNIIQPQAKAKIEKSFSNVEALQQHQLQFQQQSSQSHQNHTSYNQIYNHQNYHPHLEIQKVQFQVQKDDLKLGSQLRPEIFVDSLEFKPNGFNSDMASNSTVPKGNSVIEIMPKYLLKQVNERRFHKSTGKIWD